MLFLIILIYFIIAFIDMMPLYKKKQKKELLVYMVLLSVALTLSLLLSFGVEILSTSKAIEKIVKLMLGK
jgi:uncharacterized membrane protein YwzB